MGNIPAWAAQQLGQSGIVNFLHYGNALDKLGAALQGECNLPERAYRRVLASLPGCEAKEPRTLLTGFAPRERRISVPTLRACLSESETFREAFRALGCRGFSYWVDSRMRGYNSYRSLWGSLGRHVNFRLALMAGDDLFYPPKVREWLRRCPWGANHFFHAGRPAICFGLGTRVGRELFLLVLQSDVAAKGPSHVREHFRGWRRILFANILAITRGEIDAVYLCTAEDAQRAAYGARKDEGGFGDWRDSYDRFASRTGMSLVELPQAINVRIYARQKPVYASSFFHLQVAQEQSGEGGQHAA